MAWSFVKLETWKYRKLLQRRFWKPSGILDHEFSILDPGHSRWTSITDEDGRQRQVPESAYCVLAQDGIITEVFIPKDEFPDVFEAVILLHQAQYSGTRVGRYMTIYQAYECIVEDRDLSFSAIRHALSHASSFLNRKSTVDELNRIFGSTQINYDTYRLLKEFNVRLGRLLIATDNALEELVSRESAFIKSASIRAENLDAA